MARDHTRNLEAEMDALEQLTATDSDEALVTLHWRNMAYYIAHKERIDEQTRRTPIELLTGQDK